MFYITPYDFCQWNLNSGFQSSLAGFRIPNAEFRIPKPQAKTFPVLDSRLHQGTVQETEGKRGICLLQNELNRAFSLSWPASMQIYWNKRNRLHKKRVQLPQDLVWNTNMAAVTSCAETLYSDVARFTTHESNLSCNKSVCCRLRKVVAESRELFYFLQENLYNLRAFYRPKANLFCSKRRNFHVSTYSATPA